MPIPQSIRVQFRLLDLFPEYFVSIKRLGWDKAWGPALVCIAYCMWWFSKDGPPWYVTMAFICGLILVTGYYLWREDHIRLIPKLELGDIVVIRIPPNLAAQKFVQLTVKSANDGTINDCRGQLLRVSKWSARQSEWQPTQIDGTIDLLWSELDVPNITLEPGAPRRLVIFAIENNNWDILVWDAKKG